MMEKKSHRIRKKDYCRVLVTETLPYETPIIFSNEGLYEKVVNTNFNNPILKILLDNLIFGKDEKKTKVCIPYLYKIKKNSSEFRRLALIHPNSQWRIKKFYEKYENLLLYHCAHSPASIRAPHKVAGSFFSKGSLENLNQYKNKSISLLPLDELTRHSPTFFSYRGYDRLYKFFESKDYFKLEKRYEIMLTLDVSKCFDSIYTHTMSWAVKDKEFSKKNISEATFASEFDKLMQNANHGETNGIVIGPEVSRVFAEILFQEIDMKSILRLKENKLNFGCNYDFRRYVDDVFIFANKKEDAQQVYKTYADIMLSFNLHQNNAKSITLTRPFITNKSRLIHAINIEVNIFMEKFLDANEGFEKLTPKNIHSTWKLTRSFIESIKSLCSYNQANYDEVASYLISVLTERVKKIVAVKEIINPKEEQGVYKDALFVLLDIFYFLYEISPSISASYKLCTSLVLIIRFTKKHLPMLENTMAHRIYELTESLFTKQHVNNQFTIDGFIPLELLNIILATRELGKNYLIPQTSLESLFQEKLGDTYFGITTCLFYIKDESSYTDLRKIILEKADKKLSDLSDIQVNSEKTYLLLDLLSCPYIPEKKKKSWINETFKALGETKPKTSDITTFLQASQNSYALVNWNTDVDLLNSLEKKELKQVY